MNQWFALGLALSVALVIYLTSNALLNRVLKKPLTSRLSEFTGAKDSSKTSTRLDRVAMALEKAFARLSKVAVARRSQRQFAEGLPNLLNVLSGSLKVGLSFNQALEAAVKHDETQVGRQLNEALREVKLGLSLEEALTDTAIRMNSVELRWLVAALKIHRETGGNLSTLLENLRNTMHDRAEVQREIKVLSAEGRLSAYILLAIPFLIVAALVLIRPGYLAHFVTSVQGFVMLLLVAALMLIGWVWIRRIVQVNT